MSKFYQCIGAILLLLVFSEFSFAESFVTMPGGLQYRDLRVGTGVAAEAGSTVTVHISGWVDQNGQKGKEIYRTRKENKPVSFVVGTDKVIPGWNEGVIGMQAGGTRLLLVPPELGFGNRAVEDVIPAQAHLRFIIELLEIK
jgi:FKBP-type peptidyl-prolyl cis-trans isomerase